MVEYAPLSHCDRPKRVVTRVRFVGYQFRLVQTGFDGFRAYIHDNFCFDNIVRGTGPLDGNLDAYRTGRGMFVGELFGTIRRAYQKGRDDEYVVNESVKKPLPVGIRSTTMPNDKSAVAITNVSVFQTV